MAKSFARTFGTAAEKGGGGFCDQTVAKSSKKARSFGQDLLDNEGAGVRLARGVRRSTGANPVEGQPGFVAHPAIPGRGTSGVGLSYTDKGFYYQKKAKEVELGRDLSTEEFIRDHYKIDSSGKKTNRAIPGGETGANSAYMFRQPDGSYAAGEEAQTAGSGTSIFDPVLTELSYRWFAPKGGWILDPFAGGSVRGIVASTLGYRYVGVDLRAEQIAANEVQGVALCGDPIPTWLAGDSRNIGELCAGLSADFIFSCPPYADLERYSDDPADISTLSYPEFRPAYAEIIAATAALLKPNRFACFVVGDVRGKDGMYYGLPWHTVEAFGAAGLKLYNSAILVTAVGSLPVRVGRQFRIGRKLGTTHQHVFVFSKGDPSIAAKAVENGE